MKTSNDLDQAQTETEDMFALWDQIMLFSYLGSSHVSGNVYILCHLHRQAKVHQNCLVWHQDDVTG